MDPTATGQCINIEAFFVGNAAASVATDFLILLTPIPIVWGLQMPFAQRMTVLGIFFLGGLYVMVSHQFASLLIISSIFSACVAGLYRIFVEQRMFASSDLTWGMSQAFIWSSVEPNIGIVCACLPTFRSLMRRFIPKWFAGSSLDKSGTGAQYGTNFSSKLRSQTGEFYELSDRNTANKNNSDDEMGLTNTFESNGHQPRASTGDSAGAEEDHNGIMVKHEIDWSSTAALHR